jgi:hypothetical protein
MYNKLFYIIIKLSKTKNILISITILIVLGLIIGLSVYFGTKSKSSGSSSSSIDSSGSSSSSSSSIDVNRIILINQLGKIVPSTNIQQLINNAINGNPSNGINYELFKFQDFGFDYENPSVTPAIKAQTALDFAYTDPSYYITINGKEYNGLVEGTLDGGPYNALFFYDNKIPLPSYISQ